MKFRLAVFFFFVCGFVNAQLLVGLGGGLGSNHFLLKKDTYDPSEQIIEDENASRFYVSFIWVKPKNWSPEFLVDAEYVNFFYKYSDGFYSYSGAGSSKSINYYYKAIFTNYSFLINQRSDFKNGSLLVGAGPVLTVANGNYSGTYSTHSQGGCISCIPSTWSSTTTSKTYDNEKYRDILFGFNFHALFNVRLTENLGLSVEGLSRISKTGFQEYSKRISFNATMGLHYYLKPSAEWGKKKTAE